MSDLILLQNVRISFPHLIEPQKSVNAQTGKERISYNCDLIMPQDHAGFTEFLKRYSELALEKWKNYAKNAMEIISKERKNRCFGHGSEKVNQKTYAIYDGYEGNVFISAGRSTPPQMIQKNGTAIEPSNTLGYQEVARGIYAGCRVNAAIKPWLQDNAHGKAVRCDLVAIQFAADDEPFGEGATDASSLFSATSPEMNFNNVPGLPSFLK